MPRLVEQASLPVSWTGKDAYPTVCFSSNILSITFR